MQTELLHILICVVVSAVPGAVFRRVLAECWQMRTGAAYMHLEVAASVRNYRERHVPCTQKNVGHINLLTAHVGLRRCPMQRAAQCCSISAGRGCFHVPP